MADQGAHAERLFLLLLATRTAPTDLLVAQGDDGVDPCGAPGRDPGGGAGRNGEANGDYCEGQRICGGGLEQEALDDPGGCGGAGGSRF